MSCSSILSFIIYEHPRKGYEYEHHRMDHHRRFGRLIANMIMKTDGSLIKNIVTGIVGALSAVSS